MAVTEEQRKQNAKFLAAYMGIIIGIVFAYIFGYVGSLLKGQGSNLITAFGDAFTNIRHLKLFYPLNTGALTGIAIGLLLGGVMWFYIDNDNKRNYAYKKDEVAGTGGYMNQKDFKEYKEKYIAPDPEPFEKYPIKIEEWDKQKQKYSSNMIMTNAFCRPIDSRALIGNNNTMIVGGAGTGKSRFYIKPNVLQMNASYVITDPSGEMIQSLGKVLVNNGYKLKIFNLVEFRHSNCYNPLHYIRNEAGVNMLISCFINNTTKGDGGGDNQFFVDAEKLLYAACIFYLLDFCTEERMKNFAGIIDLVNSSQVDENNANFKSPLDEIFDKLPRSSLAWNYYKSFKQAAGKTLKSIIISCVTRLQPFLTPQIRDLTKTDELELDKMGDEKTALFIITPQADRTYSFLASMLYTQMFETLYYIGEKRKAATGDERLPIPVRCMMDEFANIGEVPEFPSKLATMRKYNISASIVLQDIAQIEAMYKDDWKTLVGNCSSILFLGTQEINTLKWFSEMLGKTTVTSKSISRSKGKSANSSNSFQQTQRDVATPDELGRLDAKECIVFTQNMRPYKDAKYKYERHPYFSQTADASSENGFEYKKLSAFDNSKTGTYTNIFVAMNEAIDIIDNEKGKFVDTDDVVVEGDPNEMANGVNISEEDEQMLYSTCSIECVNEALKHYEDPVCMVKLDGVPTKYLKNLALQVSKQMQKEPFVVFSGAPNNKHIVCGVGVGKDVDRIAKAMQNDMVKSMNVSADAIEASIDISINEYYFDDYRKEVNKKYSGI